MSWSGNGSMYNKLPSRLIGWKLYHINLSYHRSAMDHLYYSYPGPRRVDVVYQNRVWVSSMIAMWKVLRKERTKLYKRMRRTK